VASWLTSVFGVSDMLSTALTQRIERALRGLQHGAVQLVIHDAQVVRIERVERVRLTVSPEAAMTTEGPSTTTVEMGHGEHGD